eukprot:g2199.t1
MCICLLVTVVALATAAEPEPDPELELELESNYVDDFDDSELEMEGSYASRNLGPRQCIKWSSISRMGSTSGSFSSSYLGGSSSFGRYWYIVPELEASFEQSFSSSGSSGNSYHLVEPEELEAGFEQRFGSRGSSYGSGSDLGSGLCLLWGSCTGSYYLSKNVCGACEPGERCLDDDCTGGCRSDCPYQKKMCATPPFENAGECGSATRNGKCIGASGACDCNTERGFVGRACGECKAGYVLTGSGDCALVVCKSPKYVDNEAKCVPCPAGHKCDGNAKTPCARGKFAVAASGSLFDHFDIASQTTKATAFVVSGDTNDSGTSNIGLGLGVGLGVPFLLYMLYLCRKHHVEQDEVNTQIPGVLAYQHS